MLTTVLAQCAMVLAVLLGGGITAVLTSVGGGLTTAHLELGAAFALLNWAGLRALPATAAGLVALHLMHPATALTEALILLVAIAAAVQITHRTHAGAPQTCSNWIHALIFVAPLASLVAAGLRLLLADEQTTALSGLTFAMGLDAGAVGFGLVGAAPLLLLLPNNQTLHSRNRGVIAATTVIFILLAMTVYFHLCSNARERAASDLSTLTDSAAHRIQQDLNTYVTALRGVEALFASSTQVTREEFDIFAKSLQTPLPGLYAVAWDAYVPASQREDFVARMRATGLPEFEIFEVVDGRRQRAPDRPYTVPVAYARYEGEPLKALGYDMASEPTRAAALQQALFSGTPVASGRVKLVTDPDPHYDILVLMTMRGATHADELIGYAGLAVRVSELMRAAAESLPPDMLARLYDRSAPPESAWLFGAAEDFIPDAMALRHSTVFDIAGRRWELELIAPPEYVTRHIPLGAALVLWLGLLASAAVLLVLTAFEDTYRRAVA